MKDHIKTCEECSNPFEAKGKLRRRITCSDECKSKRYAKNALKAWVDKPKLIELLKIESAKRKDAGFYKRSGQKLVDFSNSNPEFRNSGLKNAHAKLRGNHGYGRTQRGRVDHITAVKIIVRSPIGETFVAQNVSEWCRKNESLFCPHNEHRFKTPLWLRAAQALTQIAIGKTTAHALTSWRGWMAEKWEHSDYLNREIKT